VEKRDLNDWELLVVNHLGSFCSADSTVSVLLHHCCDKSALCFTHQVELLWRRAEGDARKVQSGKLYMLVSAELLDYDVSRRVEESLEKHSHAVPGLFSNFIIGFSIIDDVVMSKLI